MYIEEYKNDNSRGMLSGQRTDQAVILIAVHDIASLGGLLEVQIWGLFPKLAESEALLVDPGIFYKLSSSFLINLEVWEPLPKSSGSHTLACISHLEGLLNSRLLVPSRVSDSVGLGQCLRTVISHKFQVMWMLLVQGPHFKSVH